MPSFSGLQIFSSARILYRGISDRLGSPGSTTRTMLEKPCPLRRWRCAQSGVYVWLTFEVHSRGTEGWPYGSLCIMADIKMTQRYALRQARVRALRVVAAYASIREWPRPNRNAARPRDRRLSRVVAAARRTRCGKRARRPRTLALFAEVREAAQQQGLASIQKLVQIRDDPKAPFIVQIAACNALLDRGYGRPVQGVAVQRTGSVGTKQRCADSSSPPHERE